MALPYKRSSLSGPLHVAMGYGLPVLMSDTGGNPEAAEGYGGIVLHEPGDAQAIAQGLRRLAELRGERFAHPRSWSATAAAYDAFLDRVEGRTPSPPITLTTDPAAPDATTDRAA